MIPLKDNALVFSTLEHFEHSKVGVRDSWSLDEGVFHVKSWSILANIQFGRLQMSASVYNFSHCYDKHLTGSNWRQEKIILVNSSRGSISSSQGRHAAGTGGQPVTLHPHSAHREPPGTVTRLQNAKAHTSHFFPVSFCLLKVPSPSQAVPPAVSIQTHEPTWDILHSNHHTAPWRLRWIK